MTVKSNHIRVLRALAVAILSFASCLVTAAQVSLRGQMTVEQAILQIQKETDYSFFYNSTDLTGIGSRNINVSGAIETVLESLFTGTAITWRVQDKEIVLKKNFREQKKDDDKRSVKGIVIDEVDRTQLIGATVLVKGSDSVAITDIDGKFTICGCDNRTVLDVSYVGYQPREFRVGNLGELEITLTSANELEGVIVVGAGTQKKVSVTGSIVAIKGDALKAPSSSLTNNLAGKLSGVIAVTNSGEPGSYSQFYIRGISTFGGRSTPLILLDGVEISAGDLDNLPAESIENFSILKDASATAIYGARGANGVMIITTKSGKENTKAKVNASVEQSFLQPVRVVEYADGPTYMKTYNEALLSRIQSATPRYSEAQIANTASGINPYVYPNVDWYNLMFKKFTMSQRANVNISGGGSALTYYMSIQMNHDGGLLNTPKAYSYDNNYNRWAYTFQNNIGYKITQYTKIDLRMNAQISNMKSPNVSSSDIFYQIFKNTPVSFPATFPAEEGDKHIRFGSAIMSAGRYYTNPYAHMLNTYRENRANKLNISLNLDQKFDFITEGLSLTALVNFNNYSQNYFTRSLTPYLYAVDMASVSEEFPEQYSTTKLREGTEYISQSDVTRYSDNVFYLDARLNYARSFGKHNVTAMAMYMMRQFISSVLPQRNQGFSGRATYDYDNRYLAEFNFGYNGTERLEAGKRYEFFPAMSLGWVASNEKFWTPIIDVVNYFKLRSSYGLVGSDETGLYAGAPHYLYLSNVNMNGGGNFESGVTGGLSQQGPMVNSYPVSNASWERATEFDIGVDLQLFKQFNFTFDWFSSKRDRILMKRASFPSVLGYQNAIPWANVGKVDNMGFEFSANWTKQINKDWFIDARVNWTYSKNKYVYVDEPDYPYVWQTQTGKPLDAMRGYIADGLFESQAEIDASPDQSIFGSTIMPGDIRYRDINGDNKITAEDQVMLSPYGNMPRIQYGFGISVQWKDLDVNVFFNGSAKRNIMLSGMYPFCANDSNDNNLMKWIADSHWSEGADNSNVLYPRLGTLSTQISNNNQPSSWWMRNGSFLRFKTLEIGYRLKWFRLYFSADNLAVWSKFKYWDPELSFNSYPLQRTFNIGLQFNL